MPRAVPPSDADIAQRVAVLLRRRDQKALARKLGVSQPTVSNWLNGRAKPSPWHLLLIAQLEEEVEEKRRARRVRDGAAP